MQKHAITWCLYKSLVPVCPVSHCVVKLRVISDATGPRKCNNNSLSSSTFPSFRFLTNKQIGSRNFGIERELCKDFHKITSSSSFYFLQTQNTRRKEAGEIFCQNASSRVRSQSQDILPLFRFKLHRTRTFITNTCRITYICILRIFSFVGISYDRFAECRVCGGRGITSWTTTGPSRS